MAICVDSRLWYNKFPIMVTSGITCYSTVTMSVSRTASEIDYSVLNTGVTLKSGFGVVQGQF